MSRVGKKPIPIPSGVEIKIEKDRAVVKGPKGTLNVPIHPYTKVEIEDNVATVHINGNPKRGNMYQGLTRSLLNNAVIGVSKGFEKKLLIIGGAKSGYRAKVNGKKLEMQLGFAHPVIMDIPDDLVVETPSDMEIIVKGIDKQRVGQFAADIRAWRPPNPYKTKNSPEGKGIKYADEVVLTKEGKKAM